MADPSDAKDSLGDTTDRDNAPTGGQRPEKVSPAGYLGARRRTVRRRSARVGRHDVPEKDVVLDLEVV